MRKVRILAIGGSIRASGGHDRDVVRHALEAKSLADVISGFRQLGEKINEYSNTELLSSIALNAAAHEGAEVDYFSLRNIFRMDAGARFKVDATLGLNDEDYFVDTTRIDAEKMTALTDRIQWADALILVCPVYFGDRSSVADVFMKCLHDKRLLQGKAFGTISVGAKRNGGQETTNMYALFDAANVGAFVFGNGPKTSQYGGTALAGDKGKVLDDTFGIDTSFETGRRSAQVARILVQAADYPNHPAAPATIAVIISSDNPAREVEKQTLFFLDQVRTPAVRFELINLLDYRVERCLACKICPYPPMVESGSKGKTPLGVTDYACIIDNGTDQMEVLREKLKDMSGLIIVGVNDDRLQDLCDQYQSFTERTRFIRRANFEWMNTLYTSLVIKDVLSSRERLFGLRAMSSYIRHNMIARAPLRSLSHNGELIQSPVEALTQFADWVPRLRWAREQVGPVEVAYVAGGTGGYQDTRLDHTSAKRI